MGQYKVPQDVEAEDKIIGPLTLKQFIYAVIGVAWGGITFTLFKGTPVIFIIVGLPPAILFIMLGLYRKQDQPFEVYLAAVFTYFGQSRKRLWEKEPIEEVFKVEAPVIKAEMVARDPKEVIGQLDRLARIVDTRGYANKQPEVQEPAGDAIVWQDDRLAQPIVAPIENIAPAEVAMADDILDFNNNNNARNLNVLIEDSAQAVRQEALIRMQAAPTTLQPSPVATASLNATPNPQTEAPNPVAAMLKLAMDASDLPVSEVAAQAARQQQTVAEGQTINLREPK